MTTHFDSPTRTIQPDNWWRITFTLFKHLLVIIIIYVATNLWRSPTIPDAPELYYLKNGQAIDLITLSHQTPVLVYFWGTWCSVCHLTSPNVQTLHDDKETVLTVAVSSGRDEDLMGYMHSHSYHFYTINDQDGVQFARWGGQVTPSFVIIKNGKVNQSFTGVSPLWLLRLRLWWAKLG